LTPGTLNIWETAEADVGSIEFIAQSSSFLRPEHDSTVFPTSDHITAWTSMGVPVLTLKMMPMWNVDVEVVYLIPSSRDNISCKSILINSISSFLRWNPRTAQYCLGCAWDWKSLPYGPYPSQKWTCRPQIVQPHETIIPAGDRQRPKKPKRALRLVWFIMWLSLNFPLSTPSHRDVDRKVNRLNMFVHYTILKILFDEDVSSALNLMHKVSLVPFSDISRISILFTLP
jgi:hypothetical protein